MSSGGSVLPAHIDRKLLKKDNLSTELIEAKAFRALCTASTVVSR